MARSLLSLPHVMKFLQLTAVVRDIRTATMIAQPFLRSPVTVGRRDSNSLRLDAASVSRHHGAFTFSKRGLQYVDLGSTNGTYLDGRYVDADHPVDLRDSSILTIGPFQIVPHVELVGVPVPPSDPDAHTHVVREFARPVARGSSGGAGLSAISDQVSPTPAQHSLDDILAQALDVARVTAEMIIRFRGRTDTSGSPLTSSTSQEEIVAYLLDPESGRRRGPELRALLTEMLRFPLTLLPREAT
jgi:hypothetical protein